MPLQPLRLEFGWREVAQRRMDSFVHVHIIQETADLMVGIMIVKILGQVNFFFLDRPHQTLGVAVLPGLASIGHADLNLGILQDLGIGHGRVLDALVRVVNLWRRMGDQRSLQRSQRQRVIQATPQMPASDASGEDVHDLCWLLDSSARILDN